MTRPSISKYMVLTILLSVLLGSLQPAALAAQQKDFIYILYGNEVMITGYRGHSTTVIIPSAIQGKRVTAIGMIAFAKQSSIQKVVIPNSVSIIGEQAFAGCQNLKSITIPASVTNIGMYAFTQCHSLASVTLSNGVPRISRGMFQGCTNLISITLPGSIVSVDCNAFANCSQLQKATFLGNKPDFGCQAFAGTASGFKIYYPIGQSHRWARYTEYPKQPYCIVTLHPQNGSAVSKVMIHVINGHIAAPIAPGRAGYAFAGWHKNAACTAKWDFAKDIVASDITLYAKWFKKYTITALPNNASYGTVAGGGSIAYGTTATLKATPKAGFRFVRWMEGNTAVSTSASYTFTVNKARTLKAEFAKIGTPAVTAVSAGCNGVKLAWAAVAGAQGYEISRYDPATKLYKVVTTVTTTNYTNIGLTTNTTYSYKVRAKCVAGSTITFGGYSAVVSAKTQRVNHRAMKQGGPAVPAAGSLIKSIRNTFYHKSLENQHAY